MLLKTIVCLKLCLVLSICHAKVEISESLKVMEDTWAEFSCTVKISDTIKWRIGSFTDGTHIYNVGDRLGEIEGLQTEYVGTTTSGNTKEGVIRIRATIDLNGLPIECMSDSMRGKKYDEYSQFVLLEVIPSLITEGSGADQMSRERRSVPDYAYTEEAASGGKQSVTVASLFAVFSSIAAIVARP